VECPHCKTETLLFLPPGEVNQIVNCPCQHCFGAIEFEAGGLVEENSLVACPNCGLETKLFIPPPDSPSPKLPEETESFTEQQQAVSIAKAEAAKALRAAQMKEITEIANSRLIYSHLDSLELRGEIITIKKRGVANALASGMNGARSIQISSITAIQMKPASMMTVGYILFTYAGSKAFSGGVWEATQDPDAFLFGKELNADIAEFKSKVEEKMRELKQPVPVSANNSPATLTDELRKLVEFKNQGILSQAEFEAAKKKLLN
jgi:hypothetical protein